MQGDHVGCRLGIGCLRVAQTLVGFDTNRFEGLPVGGVQPPADAEVAGIADHRLGAQRPAFLEVLLEPARLVVADQLRVPIISSWPWWRAATTMSKASLQACISIRS